MAFVNIINHKIVTNRQIFFIYAHRRAKHEQKSLQEKLHGNVSADENRRKKF